MRIETWKDDVLVEVIETPEPEPVAAPVEELTALEKLQAFLQANPDVATLIQ